jgi:hypothetical protein
MDISMGRHSFTFGAAFHCYSLKIFVKINVIKPAQIKIPAKNNKQLNITAPKK